MIIALAILLAAGAKEFAIVNKLFTGMFFSRYGFNFVLPIFKKSRKGVNISVILFVLVAGLFQADFSNWTWEPEGIYARLNNETQSGNTTDCKRESYFRSYFRF